jgi:hypothetical protein
MYGCTLIFLPNHRHVNLLDEESQSKDDGKNDIKEKEETIQGLSHYLPIFMGVLMGISLKLAFAIHKCVEIPLWHTKNSSKEVNQDLQHKER